MKSYSFAYYIIYKKTWIKKQKLHTHGIVVISPHNNNNKAAIKKSLGRSR